MRRPVRPFLSGALLLSAAAVAACADATAPSRPLSPTGASRQGGSGGGGGGTTVSAAGVLPTTAPAPDILLRESFGPGPEYLRPVGGKGEGRNLWGGGTLSGFWVEYPGNKNNAWITAPETGQTWRNCAGGDNTSTQNPFELPSPLQTAQPGCAVSIWTDVITQYPTALMPLNVALPADGYELSMEGYPAPIAQGYVAIGFTNSGAVTSNLTSSGILWLKVTDPTGFSLPLHYELRAGSLTSGRLLASGDRGQSGWNHMAIRVSPAAGTVTLNFGTVADTAVGDFADTASVTVPFTMTTPKYLAFEGLGLIDNVVVRK